MDEKPGKLLTIPNHQTVQIDGEEFKVHELIEKVRVHYASRSKRQAVIELLIEKVKLIQRG